MSYLGNGVYKFTLNGQDIEVSFEDLKSMIDIVVKYENESTFRQQSISFK